MGYHSYPPHPYFPSPQKRRSSRTAWILAGFSAVIAAAAVAVFGSVIASQHGSPHYSPDEQTFLTDVKKSKPDDSEMNRLYPWVSWPSDAEMVREGHAVCTALHDTGGNREMVEAGPIVGPPTSPSFMQNYPMDQRNELVSKSAKDLCPKYAVWFGGLPF